MDGINLNPNTNQPIGGQPQRPTPPPLVPSRPPAEPSGFKPTAEPSGFRPSAPPPPRPVMPPVSELPLAQPEGIKIIKSDLEKVMEKPETIEQVMEGVEEPKRGKGFGKTLIVLLGVLIIAGGLGTFAYFVVFPLVFPTRVAAPTLTVPLAHTSYFSVSVVSRSKITFKDLNRSTINEALNQLAASSLSAGTIKELEISGQTGQVQAADYLDKAMNLTVSKASLNNWLEKDFTAFMYYDNNGVWPGYVFKIKSGAVSAVKSDLYPDIESSADQLYISPATLGSWKNGNVSGSSTRYAIGSRPGEAFNYGIFGNYLVLSTNFDGFKVAVNSLGL